MIDVKIINKSGYPLPEYKSLKASGCDLHAVMEYPKMLRPLDRATIETGIAVQPEEGYEAQIRPRSGLASKNGIVAVLGTGDNDYTGTYKVTLINLSNEPYTVQPGERIGQMVFVKVEQANWIEVNELEETERGSNGFGSTGLK